jgi:hypothetical protein
LSLICKTLYYDFYDPIVYYRYKTINTIEEKHKKIQNVLFLPFKGAKTKLLNMPFNVKIGPNITGNKFPPTTLNVKTVIIDLKISIETPTRAVKTNTSQLILTKVDEISKTTDKTEQSIDKNRVATNAFVKQLSLYISPKNISMKLA